MRLAVILGLMFVLAMPFASSALTCSAKAACSVAEYELFSIMGSSNAHAGTYNQHSLKICCAGLTTPTRGPIGTTLLYLAAGSNSHVWVNNTGSLTPVVIGSNPQMSCKVQNPGCDVSYTTVISMATTANSHVGDASAYDNKLCCKLGCAGFQAGCQFESCCTGFYCSQTTPGGGQLPPDQWHCCPAGWWWNQLENQCEQAVGCYDPVAAGACNFYAANQTAGWLSDPECTRWTPAPIEQGCCLVGWYQGNDYDYSDIQVYGIGASGDLG